MLQRTTCYCIPIELESLEKTKGKRAPIYRHNPDMSMKDCQYIFSQFMNKGLCMKRAEPTARLTTSGIKKWVQQL